LFNLAIDSKLRGCDLVGLRVHDVVHGSRVAARAIVVQKKTERPVQFEITEQTRDAIAAGITAAHKGHADLPSDQKSPGRAVAAGHTKLGSTVRYLGIEVDDAVEIAEQTEV